MPSRLSNTARKSHFGYTLLLTSLCTTAPIPSIAGQGQVLEEIIVSARKREESIQEVPIALSAFSADQLREAGVSNIKDLGLQVPGLQIDEQSTGQIWIRGVGQRDDGSRIDAPVGVYIDGVYIARKDAQLLDMIDPESVQVLRGPQGTLFGKNTTGGAILVNSQKPAETFSGYLQTRLGNNGRRDAKVAFNLPIVEDKLFSKLTLASVRRDGYLENVLTDQDTGSEDRLSGALQLRWLASDTVTVDSFTYYNKTREVQLAANCTTLTNSSFNGDQALMRNLMWPGDTIPVWAFDAISSTAPPGTVDESQIYRQRCDEAHAMLDDYQTANDNRNGYDLDNLMAGITIEWEVSDDLTFKSITGYGDQKLAGVSNNADNDGAEGYFSPRYRVSPSERDQLSQEFQLTGSLLDESLQFTGGLFAMVENIDDGSTYQFRGTSGIFFPASITGAPVDSIIMFDPSVQLDTYELKNTTYAAFFQGSYDLTEQLQFTFGLRWTREQRDTDLQQRQLDLDAFQSSVLATGLWFPTPTGDLATILPFLPQDPLGAAQAQFPIDPKTGAILYPLGPTTDFSASEDWERVSPMASLKYSMPDDWFENTAIDSAMVYITVSDGLKSGTFEPMNNEGLRTVEPEIVTNYELGLKLDSFDRSLRTNMAVYHMTYEDMQLRQVVADSSGNPAVVLTNASESKIDGAELEVTWLPAEGWAINLAASYNDYDFVDFEDQQFYTSALFLQQPLPTVDRSGENFAEVPEKTASLGIQYTWNTAFGEITPRLDYQYTGEVFFGLDAGAWDVREQSTLDAYELFNARLSWRSPSENMEITLFGTNLSDEQYFFGAAAVGDSVGVFPLRVAPPRMYGIELFYRFGDL